MTGFAERLSARKLKGPEPEPFVISPARIYILPTRHGVLFALLLLVMLFGSINYNNSLGYALTFLLASLATVSMLHTHRNLVRLRLSTGRLEPVFAGSDARFPVCLDTSGARAHSAVAIVHRRTTTAASDVPADTLTCITVRVPAGRRGRMALGRFQVCTEYPLGLFHAWAWAELEGAVCLVYPQPEDNPPPLQHGVDSRGEQAANTQPGNEDFAGLRPYRPGDAPRRIAWKQLATSQNLFTKHFTGHTAARTVWLDWEVLTGLMAEERLSRLCRWALDCHGLGSRFGLRLPGQTIEPDTGTAHLHRCLRALALFELPRPGDAAKAARAAAR